MSILENSDMKKYLIINIFMLITFMILNFFITKNNIEIIKDEVMKTNYSIVGTLANNHPGMEEEIIQYVTQRNNLENIEKGKVILEKYGYGKDVINFNEPIISYNMNRILFTSTAITILIIGITLGISLLFFRRIYIDIDKINVFIIKVLEYREVSNILDNKDGQIGRLKNELLRMTNALNQNVELLKNEKIFLSNIISDISHQLRTPMTSLMVLNDLLHNEDLAKDKNEEFLLRTKVQLERMEWLVKSMLKLAKVDAGVIDFKKEEKSISELVSRAIEPMRIPMDIKNQSLIIEGDSNAKFTGDMEWTIEALVNIIKNCVEHTGDNGTLKITFEENSIMSRISIIDNGEGISKKDLPHIFKRFYRGKSSSKTDSVGIGLAMAKSIVESQNGIISVESEICKGTKFDVSFYKGII